MIGETGPDIAITTEENKSISSHRPFHLNATRSGRMQIPLKGEEREPGAEANPIAFFVQPRLFSPIVVSCVMSKTMPARPHRRAPRSTAIFVLGRDRFAHISAVEGIELDDEMRAAFDRFDREELSPEERRLAILRRFTPSR